MSPSRDARLPYDQEESRSSAHRDGTWSESWEDQPTEVLSEDAYADADEAPYLEDNRTLPLDSRAFHGLAEDEDRTQVLPGAASSSSRRRFDLGEEDDEPWAATTPLRPAGSAAASPEADEYGWDDAPAPGAGLPAGAATNGPAGGPAPSGLGQLSAEQLRGVVLRRQKADFGRIQLIPGFIGWVVGLGTAGLLLAIVRNYATSFGLTALPDHPADLLGAEGSDAATVLAGSGQWLIVLGVVYFLAFLVGGFAAGRAGRFSGAKQGVAVFLWVLMGTLVSSAANAVLGIVPAPSAFMVSVQALGGDDVLRGVAMALCQAVLALVAGILGGLWGTRFHRTADLVGFGLK